MTRHDLDKPARDLFNAAVRLDIIDAVELAVMVHNATTDGVTDVLAVVENITLAAHVAAFPGPVEAREVNRKWCDLANAWHASRVLLA